jgi:hypothetical protein
MAMVPSLSSKVKKGDAGLLESGLTLRLGDGWAELQPNFYDAIHVGAAGPLSPPPLSSPLLPRLCLCCLLSFLLCLFVDSVRRNWDLFRFAIRISPPDSHQEFHPPSPPSLPPCSGTHPEAAHREPKEYEAHMLILKPRNVNSINT